MAMVRWKAQQPSNYIVSTVETDTLMRMAQIRQAALEMRQRRMEGAQLADEALSEIEWLYLRCGQLIQRHPELRDDVRAFFFDLSAAIREPIARHINPDHKAESGSWLYG